MTFPSRGCRTCKQRHIKVRFTGHQCSTIVADKCLTKCDEARPICNRCRKSNLSCHGVETVTDFVFLNENNYAIGRWKRPRGPNLRSSLIARDRSRTPSSSGALPIESPLADLQSYSITPALHVPLDDQALCYYSRSYVEVSYGFPEIVDGHLKYASADWCYLQPQSILSLAILAVSHATFGRARNSHAALAVGCKSYLNALVKTNMALKDVGDATHDEVILAVMLLSFYENAATDKMSPVSNLQVMASRSFAHHDGAMALLYLRRQLGQRISCSIELDKLVRRQLMRSLLLRSMPLPIWLRNGSQYGEHGFALELDHCMVGAAELRHRASILCTDSVSLSKSDGHGDIVGLRRLLAEAQTLDNVLAIWANELPSENRYSIQAVQKDGLVETGNKILDDIIHIYPTVGHAGMWNRYHALRLTINDILLKTLSILDESFQLDTKSLEEAAHLRMLYLANDLCASVPYTLGLVQPHHAAVHNGTVVSNIPASVNVAVKATTASLLCWPLTMATMLSGIPERHHLYLRNRLLDVSEIVNDGVLRGVAAGFSTIPQSSANRP